MIASRQCFGNRIRIRRHIFPKELAVFRLIKYSLNISRYEGHRYAFEIHQYT